MLSEFFLKAPSNGIYFLLLIIIDSNGFEPFSHDEVVL